jgi:hypothetical protein
MDKDVKAAVDALLKDLAENEKAMAAVSVPSSLDLGGLPPPVEKALKMTKEQVDKAAKGYAAMEKEIEAMEKEMLAAMAKALADCKAAADKATKAYMDAIKNTDGLTSAKPSIVKVLQATGKMPDPDAIQAAVTELGKHRDEMTKKHGKDKDQAKMLASFTKDLETAAKALGGLL